MALHACLVNITVVDIVDVIDESHYQELAKKYTTVIDISQLLIQPQIGWVLNGVILEPPAGQQVPLNEMIKAKIKSYQEQASELLRDLYVGNTLLGITTEQSDQMFDDYHDVLTRIREGAWPTALYRLSQKQPSGFVTQEMIDTWIAMIAERMD